MAPRHVDFIETGAGPTVLLIHSSVAGARQWTSLMTALADRFRLVAVNLFGYGRTDGWHGRRPQTLDDQADLVAGLVPGDGSAFAVVGHSFGGAVAMKVAARHPGRVDRLVLIEPNPFYLLQAAGREAAFAEAETLMRCIRDNGGRGDWTGAAAVFADYWTGAGSWAAMPEGRRAKFAAALRPNFHEWDAVMNRSEPDLDAWARSLPPRTCVVSAADTVRSIREIVELMRTGCPGWRFVTLEAGGHMAAVTRPDLVNPVVERALS